MRREFPWKEGNYEITRREENEKKMNILDQLLRASWTNIFANLPRSLTRRVSIRIGRGGGSCTARYHKFWRKLELVFADGTCRIFRERPHTSTVVFHGAVGSRVP